MSERRHLPDERRGLTHRFEIAGHTYDVICPHCGGVVKRRETGIKGFISTGTFDDGALGEVFITLQKAGATWRGLADCFSIAVSLCLQYGVPLKVLVRKFERVRFEPLGFVRGCDEIRQTTSVVDYIFHWLALKYLHENEAQIPLPKVPEAEPLWIVDGDSDH